jgi:hypothetical protein
MTPEPMATRPLAPKAIPITNEITNELSKLNSGLFALSLRQAGILAAIMSSKAHEVTAKISIIDNNILYPNHC